MLQEVRVKAKIPRYTIKGDTIVFQIANLAARKDAARFLFFLAYIIWQFVKLFLTLQHIN